MCGRSQESKPLAGLRIQTFCDRYNHFPKIPNEFRVLSYLMHHQDRVVSQGELTEHIYAQDIERGSNTVEVFVARLRRKLGASIIETVRGLGYRLGA